MSWILTYTGKRFDTLNPKPEDICIEDIAHALSMICRFGGHCRQFYSVAQHCLLVSCNLPVEAELWGLMHDAAEAYVGDVVTPIKRLLYVENGGIAADGFWEFEEKILHCVATALDMAWPPPKIVREIDTRVMLGEADFLMEGRAAGCGGYFEEPIFVRPLSMRHNWAEDLFLARYRHLRNDAKKGKG